MYLWRVFLVRPFAALSVLTCLAALLMCWSVVRKRAHQRVDRFLVGFVGLLAVSQGLRLLRDCGVLTLPANAQLNDMVELLITAFYLMATLVLKLSSIDRMNADFLLRMARAAPPKPLGIPAPPLESAPSKGEIQGSLTRALPGLSEGAFKLYAYLCMHLDNPVFSQVKVNRQELLRNCGCSESDFARHASELEVLGTAVVRPQESSTEIHFLVSGFRDPSSHDSSSRDSPSEEPLERSVTSAPLQAG